MLYSERKRLQEIAQRKASGDNIWTRTASQEARTKIIWTVDRFGLIGNQYNQQTGAGIIKKLALGVIARSTGRETGNSYDSYVYVATDDQLIDVIEATSTAIFMLAEENPDYDGETELAAFEKMINDVLESYCLSYSLNRKEVIEFEDKELHTNVVIPTLKLITREGWENVEVAYQDALRSITGGKPASAITEATTALQEALRLLGCDGDSFGDIIKSAKNTILKGYDSKYIDAIDNLINWASAVRAKKGGTHKVTETTKNEAWLTVHLVGALLLYLSSVYSDNKPL